MLRIAFAGALALCAFISTVGLAEARRIHVSAQACSDLDQLRGLCLGGGSRAVARGALNRGARYSAASAQHSPRRASLGLETSAQILPHPAGCPGRAFC